MINHPAFLNTVAFIADFVTQLSDAVRVEMTFDLCSIVNKKTLSVSAAFRIAVQSNTGEKSKTICKSKPLLMPPGSHRCTLFHLLTRHSRPALLFYGASVQ